MLLIEPCILLTLLSFRQASYRLCSPVRQERDGPAVGPRTVLHPYPGAQAFSNMGPMPREREKQVVYLSPRRHRLCTSVSNLFNSLQLSVMTLYSYYRQFSC